MKTVGFYFFLVFVSQLHAANLSYQSCVLPEMKEQASCTTIQVFEDRESNDRKIPIHVAILRATNKNALSDPLFVFAGGPGQAASIIADFASEHFAKIRDHRDLVFVDVRGTGESNPLTCNLYGPDVQSYFGDLFPIDRLKQCRLELEKRANLKLYTTTEIVRDLEEVRKALGYGKINLYGTSYGTRVALVYMRMFPDSLRTVILHGPAPTNLKAPLYHAWAGQQSLEDIFTQCSSDNQCQAAFPNVRKEFEEIVKRIQDSNMTTEITDRVSGQTLAISLSRGVFAEALRNLLYNPKNAAQVPLWIHQAFHGDFRIFAETNLSLRRAYQQGLAFGMFHSVSCAEDVPFITDADIDRETKGTFLKDYRIVQQQKACEIWPRGAIPRGYHEPVRSDVPTMIVTGELDPVTPPLFGKEIAQHLTKAKNIVVRGGSHSGGDECMDRMMVQFLLAANPNAVDDSCLSNNSKSLEFVVQ
jgi:pimeloyl-ACP methyl ester carboxylesterase